MGDGFSKMLKKLNINNNNNVVKEEIVNISLDDYKDDDLNIKNSNKNLKMTLPKVRLNSQQNNSNKTSIDSLGKVNNVNNNLNKDASNSNEQFETVVENMTKKEININKKNNKTNINSLTEPKVLKIYKKNK